jgi:Tol biopolymer transport system component
MAISLLVVVAMLVVLPARDAPAGVAGPNPYSAPEWFPLRGDWVVGCTWSNPGCPGYHPNFAIDLARNPSGTIAGDPVYAAGAGVARIFTQGNTCGGPSTPGNIVEVDHSNGIKSYYFHLGSFAISGPTWVDENTVLGFVSNTGYNDPCDPPFYHLHFQVEHNGTTVSPGQLKACHGNQLVTYPAALPNAPDDWNEVPRSTGGLHSDGTACAAAPAPGGSFTGVTPVRLLDTRTGNGAPKQTVPAGGQVALQVTGRGNVPVSGAESVVLNVTVVGASGGGFVTVFPTGSPRPTASNLNFKAGQTVANLVTVRLGVGGKVTLYASAATNLLADVTGWFSTPQTASNRAGLYHPIDPYRIADSRARFGMTTPTAGATRVLQVAGSGIIPHTGISAVVINITVANPTATGYLTAFPTGVARPVASSINFVKGDVRSNRAIVALGSGGRLSFYNPTGSTPTIVDVVGWLSDATAPTTGGGAYFVSLSPTRLIDTRIPLGDLAGPLRTAESAVQRIAAQVGVPSGVGETFPVAVVGNLTAVSPTATGYLTAFPPYEWEFGTPPPVSDVNFKARDVVPNMVVTQLDAGRIGLYNRAGTTQLLFDVSGYFALPVAALTIASPVAGADMSTIRMSNNGNLLAVTTPVALAGGDTNGLSDAYIVDRSGGTRRRASVTDSGGQANGSTWEAVVSDDGRYAAFVSDATNLVPGDTNDMPDVFVRDFVDETTTRVNVGPGDVESDTFIEPGFDVSISKSGTRVAFHSAAGNLVNNDTNGMDDMFVADLLAGTVERVSLSTGGSEADDITVVGTIAGDGNHVVFVTQASTLVSGDTNDASDVFVRDLTTDTTTRVSVSSSEAQGNDWSYGYQSISDNGRIVTFNSLATNLVPGDTNTDFDVFIRDRTLGTTTRITAPTGVEAQGLTHALSGDGTTILFLSLWPTLSPPWGHSTDWALHVYRLADKSVTPVRGYGYFQPFDMALSHDGSDAIVMSYVDGLVPDDHDSTLDHFVLSLP